MSSEHKDLSETPGEMDVETNMETYGSFMSWAKYTTYGLILLLIAMAIFLL